jgi:hypothetical protein
LGISTSSTSIQPIGVTVDQTTKVLPTLNGTQTKTFNYDASLSRWQAQFELDIFSNL